MTTTNPEANFNVPARQSRAAILIFILKFINNTFRKGWALLVPAFLALRKLSLDDWQIYVLGFVIAAIYIVFSYLSYQRFFYYVLGEEIIIEKGILYKTKISLPFDKVQTINFKQNILQQALGVLTLEIDAAGSGTEEISLEALRENRAKQFRDYILDRRGAAEQLVEGESSPLDSDKTEDHTWKKRETKTLLRLQPVDLIKIGISQNHLRSMVIFAAFVWNIYDQLKKQLNFNEEEKIEELTGFIGNEWLGRLGLTIAIVLLLSLIVSLGLVFFRNLNFRLLETGEAIKKRYGLFERQEQSTTLSKIQSVSWGDNLIKKLFGLFVFRMYPAAGTELNSKKTISVPGCYRRHVKTVLDLIFGNQEVVHYSRYPMSRLFIRRYLLFSGILPAVFLAALTCMLNGFYGLFFLLWIPLAFVAVKVYYNKWQLFLSEDILKIQYGLFSHQNKMMFFHKVQGVKLSQSPYQKRNRLASLELFSAGRNFSINYLSYDTALQLQNYILYKVESYEETWM